MRIKINPEHWRKPLSGCTHGPKEWPWWRRFSVSFVTLGVCPPSTGYRLWVYTRPQYPGGGNVGRTIDIIFDRRPRT